MRILVVEDDPAIAFLIETLLETHKYTIDLASDGQVGLDLSDAYAYDAILLDVTLPKKDGVSVCREIRARGNSVPILLLTALDSPADRTRGLDAGADDYLGKPFDRNELLARIRALLRRSHDSTLPILTWGSLQLDPVSTTVTFDERLVPLTPKEYSLLELFLRNSKRVFSCSAILDRLWSEDSPSEDTIRTHIKGLRHKLRAAGAAADFIETVYGIGYRLKPLEAPGTPLLTEAWEKFKGQVSEQVATLEQLAQKVLDREVLPDWQERGKQIAHSLTGSLGTFGFSLSSELARQIEKLLGEPQDWRADRGRLLYSIVTALREELERSAPVANLPGFESELKLDILLVSAADPQGERIQSLASTRDWLVQIVPTIAAARSQLQQYRIRSIVLTPDALDRTEEVLRLLVEVNKQVPPIPVIALTAASLHPAIRQLGTLQPVDPLGNVDPIESIERAIAEAESSQTHILAVDDDLKILAILRALLVPWGYRVTTLADSQKLWEVLPITQPDLLILDVEMPLVGGLDVCRSIRDRPEWSHLPIIVLTAHTEPTLIQQVFAIGADDFATKPVIGPEIIARITNLLERQQVQRLKTDRKQQQVATARIQLADRVKIQAALMAIEAALQSEQPFQPDRHRQILEQVNILRQLLLPDL
ncbi:response regulator [Chamaesiphon minutus]|uniref:Response regulator with CheY-like receiver domain and winged-helix DNA-binding domain n=1 Tax=Chamaesiphon minutus (strain ATCC 27169 / PCC 6605) TaxID=1173020 RepID=K9UPQ8_CHAP6|nr:response regulator [Chamaesiphon minutus]AFY96775.1 response regulator with CheY-like receiver domain and winged-helix DNA-binding domain [Chamaesiphon minutus PCC 6605]